MPNQNETECGCMAIYNATTGGCDDPNGVDPCPDSSSSNGFWQNVAGLDWGAINQNALQWGYGLGLLKPPSTTLDSQVYMLELQKQKQQMMMIMVALGILMLIVVIIVLRQGKKK